MSELPELPDRAPLFACPRSGHWATVRATHLKDHDCCAACGGLDHLQVHHVEPFHEHPEKELDPANLITLCESPHRLCHLLLGHGTNWHGWNPDVRADAARFRRRMERSAALAHGERGAAA